MTPPPSRRKLSKVIAPAVEAALANEEITRQRVEALEAWAEKTGEAVSALQSVATRDFRGRLTWLLRGR